MKNTLRIALGLMAAAALMGCQKNADKQGVAVRGGRTLSASGMPTATGSGSSMGMMASLSVSNTTALGYMIAPQVTTGSVGSYVSSAVGIQMCGKVAGTTSTTAVQMPASNAHIEVDVTDSYAQSYGLPAISTYLPFISGYTQYMPQYPGYTYVAAEFGDGSGNVAFDGFVDASGNLVNGHIYNDTFAYQSTLAVVGSFTINGTAWISGCP